MPRPNGRAALRFFEEEMDQRVHDRDHLERELSVAISEDAIRPYFQPVVNLYTRNVVGFESVPRWIHPTLGEIARDRFIPIAENNGSIHDLSEHGFKRHACRELPHNGRATSNCRSTFSPAS